MSHEDEPGPDWPPMVERFAIINGIRHGYDRMLDQFVDDFWDKHIQITDPAAAVEDHRRFVSGQKLLRRRSFELPFNAEVVSDLVRRDDLRVVRNRLLYGVLASVVLKGDLKRSVLERDAAERKAERADGRGGGRSGRSLEPEAVPRFLKEWGSVFSRAGFDEKGAARYSSVFHPLSWHLSAEDTPSEGEFYEYAERELETDLLGLPAHYLPSYIRSLEGFLAAWKESLQRLARDADADPARLRFLQGKEGRATFLQLLLHNAVVDVLSLHWIADRRRDDMKVLRTSPSLTLSEADARYLRESYARLFPPSLARKALFFAGIYYKRWGALEAAIALWSEALSDPAVPGHEREVLISSIGIVHRDRGNTKLATKAFTEAVDIARSEADLYRLGLALKNLAEARALNSKERLSRETFAEAAGLLARLGMEDCRNLAWNLAMSLRRCGFRDLENKALEQFIRTSPDDTEQVIYTNQRLTELGPYASLREVKNPFVVDPAGSSPDERLVFLLRISDRTRLDEKVEGPNAGFEELLDEVQPLIEKPFRSRPGAGVGFTHSQVPSDPNEYSRVVVCFDRKWVRWIESLAARDGFSSALLLQEVAQMLTYDRLELLDELAPGGEAGAAKLDNELRKRAAAHFDAFFQRWAADAPRPFYLFHILSIEDAVEDALYHFFGIRFDDGRPPDVVHGRRAAHAEDWYPVYWNSGGPLKAAGAEPHGDAH